MGSVKLRNRRRRPGVWDGEAGITSDITGLSRSSQNNAQSLTSLLV
jgi:hypothetical protein